MDTLQTELQDTYPALHIQLLGINQRGQEPGNASTTEGRDLPWLQDLDTDGNYQSDVARDLWDLTYRDLVILDGDNIQVAVLNLDDHNLAITENYDTLREMLVDAAMQSQLPWKNSTTPEDVDGNEVVVPLDVLLVVNELNSTGSRKLPPPVEGQPAFPYFDCSGDGDLTPLDALLVVNYLNEESENAVGEGESDLSNDGLSSEQVGVFSDVPAQEVPRNAPATAELDMPRLASDSDEQVLTPLDEVAAKLADSLPADSASADSVSADSVFADSVFADSVFADSVFADSVFAEVGVSADDELLVDDERFAPASIEPAITVRL